MTPFKISVLVFLRDARGRLLLIKRRKAPNLGCWSPIGGKLEMARGESPFECAIRETAEEVGLAVTEQDLRLFGYISEKNYEGGGHWLMFLFDCKKTLPTLPPTGDEGEFAFLNARKLTRCPSRRPIRCSSGRGMISTVAGLWRFAPIARRDRC